jgi:hypothetical protein
MYRNLDKFPLWYDFNHWKECSEFTSTKGNEQRECQCDFRIRGIVPDTSHINIVVSAYDGKAFIPRQQRFLRCLEELDAQCQMGIDGHPILRVRGNVMDEISRKIALSPNCAILHPPVHYNATPETTLLPSLSADVHAILYAAEVKYFSELEMRTTTGTVLRPFKSIPIRDYLETNPTEIKSLARLAYEAASPFCWVKSGLAISSSATLRDNGEQKLYDVTTSYCRPVRGLLPAAERLVSLFPLVIDIMTHMCGATPEIGKHIGQFDLEEIVKTMYLGSAGGINANQGVTAETIEDVEGIRNPNGKKFELLEASMRQFLEFFEKGKRPFMSFKVSYKEEIYFCESPEKVAAKKKKGRVYVIPNLVTLLFEHVIGITRKIELGGSIGVGRTWSQGGMDALLQSMGVFGKLDEYELNEGDVEKIDQSLVDVLVNLFFSSRVRYFDPTHPSYPELLKVVRLLIEEFTQRVTHIVGEIWATVVGGVPSGSLHTSHMDSWILLFLFVLFCMDVRQKNPNLSEDIMEALLTKMITIVVYGDDNWYLVKKGPLTSLLNARQWKVWLKEHFGIVYRDERVGHSLVSQPKNGFFAYKGGVYLRHYCVKNPHTGPNQPQYLPYRPMQEIVLKVVYGREPKPRDAVNLLLSTLGHAYGTYGSNPNTYLWLWSVYRSIIQISGKPAKEVLGSILRMEKDVLRKCRQVNMTPEQLLSGFPTMECLKEKNMYCSLTHSVGSASLRASQVH